MPSVSLGPALPHFPLGNAKPHAAATLGNSTTLAALSASCFFLTAATAAGCDPKPRVHLRLPHRFPVVLENHGRAVPRLHGHLVHIFDLRHPVGDERGAQRVDRSE